MQPNHHHYHVNLRRPGDPMSVPAQTLDIAATNYMDALKRAEQIIHMLGIQAYVSSIDRADGLREGAA